MHYSFFPQTCKQEVSMHVTVFFEMGAHGISIVWYKIFILVLKVGLRRQSVM